MTMDEQGYARLVPSIGGGATFKSQERSALSFPQDTGLSYDEAYEWVQTSFEEDAREDRRDSRR